MCECFKFFLFTFTINIFIYMYNFLNQCLLIVRSMSLKDLDIYIKELSSYIKPVYLEIFYFNFCDYDKKEMKEER